MKIYLVIPAYNEAKRIENLLESLKEINLPAILVDDGSLDKTFELAKKYPVTVLRHKVNLGKGAALKTGCEAAILLGAEAVILMDSDGQHKVSDLPKFVGKISMETYDVVFGSRNLNIGVPLVRYIGNKIESVLISLLYGIYISDPICGFRAITKKAYQKMKLESTGYDIETEMVIKTKQFGFKYCEVPVETVYYDKFKGVTILDALGILANILKWKIFK